MNHYPSNDLTIGCDCREANGGGQYAPIFCVMRRITALVLTICCGVLFVCWLLPLAYLITGRASFGGGGLPIEYICFSVIGLVSGCGFYAGLRGLLARSPKQTSRRESTKQIETNRLARVVGWVLVSFGGLALYTLAQVRAQTTSFDRLMFIVWGAVFCLALGGACLFAFRKHPQ
jgi:membrane protein implicated in regulation of membrane protease activity